ncbi:uncharacterized protein LOC129226681 [Uloborus diversus]|uniref:uncharacterized protein LOC129226681 n=1 Tax=Uloborus diversus TaxID=327109 RepID=UPI00240A819A|nr:uncharacterized protein LOC129226681 [Uloborus diversus]
MTGNSAEDKTSQMQHGTDEKAVKMLRGRAKAALTRITNFINVEGQIFDKFDLRNKLERLDSIFIEFNKADSELPEELSEIEQFEETYYATKVKLQKALETVSVNLNPVQIENNDSMPIGLLCFEPASIIKHIPISETGYTEAWDKLLARYDNKKQIISSLIKTFMDQPDIVNANCANLRNLTDTSDEVIRGLKSIDSKADSRDIWLIYILLQKLDSKTREEWAKHTTKEEFPTFEMFLEFLNNKCVSLESCNSTECNEIRNSSKNNKNSASNRFFTADIEKMYRQILVSDEDQPYQQIVWRYNAEDKIQTYRLKTVTYGLASASFLATRCIKQIALDTPNPKISRILQEDVYMDDLLSGSSNFSDAISICKNIASILQSYGFNLRKWNSNSSKFLEEFPEQCSSETSFEINRDAHVSSKVLGLFWNSTNDTFAFKVNLSLSPPYTKRRILSESARIFDPLGLLAPCVVTIKIFYQKLWLIKGDWDSPIPKFMETEWLKFQASFNEINDITIPRSVTIDSECEIELHGFADASSLAYAAVIYCRQTVDGSTTVSLLVAKTKVAPLKQISIPRLELCAAHLLAKLFLTVLNSLKNFNLRVFAWTDSKVVLSWLSSHPRKWKTFVANRISEIIEVLTPAHWNFVSSRENPSDIASRGIDPKCLPNCDLWWHGPHWLHSNQMHWPTAELHSTDVVSAVKAEEKSNPMFNFHASSTNDLFVRLVEKYSSLSKIIRILAYCYRFINLCKKRIGFNIASCNTLGSLTSAETRAAEEKLIHWVQDTHFSEEKKCIRLQKPLKRRSPLRSLFPFIDGNGLLRVGGRLQNADLPMNRKHPIIIPSQHRFCELLIREKHVAYLHAGPTLLSHILRQSYWIIGGKRLINKCVNQCIKCHRFKTSNSSQLMGNLPKPRVTLERAFFHSGIDYAGPVSIKFSKGRGAKVTKGYIALFICLSTKAVHIEVVSDLTTEAFIAALRRFSARRGTPRHIYSDNATNFHGAHRKLNEIEQSWLNALSSDPVVDYLTQFSIEWHFIPPSAPHFGGIWEAGIRSVKFHLKRVIGETALTFEELTTLTTQIEALLNSRPITCVDVNDTDSINALTPSHFLTGDVISSIPDPANLNEHSFKGKWELIQNLRKGFWKQ